MRSSFRCNNNSYTQTIVFGLLSLLLTITSAYARDNDNSLIKTLTGYDINEVSPIAPMGLKLGGWIETGFSGNPHRPRNQSNYPVSFNDGANQFKLHQLYAFIEKEVDTTADAWDIGIRADLLYGTDAKFSATTHFDSTILGDSPKHQLVFPQLYADIYAPIGHGITLSIGHFYTPIGYESVMSPDNFFFSHAYSMLYGEPFTHMGILLSYPINNNLTIKSGVVAGWDNLSRRTPNYLGELSYTTNDDKSSITAAVITGDTRTDHPHENHNRTMYSIVLEHQFSKKLHYVLQHDFATEAKTTASPAATWYGINQYFIYDFSNALGAGLRLEWFHDKNSSRVMGNGRTEDFIGVTVGLNYKPVDGIILRPEIRYDAALQHDVFKEEKSNDQLLLSISAILNF